MIISPSNYHGNKDKWDIYTCISLNTRGLIIQLSLSIWNHARMISIKLLTFSVMNVNCHTTEEIQTIYMNMYICIQ